MTRSRVTALVLAICLAASARARADQGWTQPVNAHGFPLTGLPGPTLGTQPLRLQDVAVGNCLLAATGTNVAPLVCATPSGLFIPDAPLGFSGSGPPHLQLTLDGTSLGVSAGAAQRLALTFSGAITGTMAAGSGSLSTAFGTQNGNSLFGVAGASTAVPAPIVATTANTVPLFDGTVVGWSAIPPGATSGIVASWPLTTVRTFCLDAVNGNDANPGFSDSAGPYTLATLCKATEAGLSTVLPTVIDGRKGRILYNPTSMPVTWLGDLLTGFAGYSSWVVRPTATNTTAGATAGADDANDRVFSAFTTATNANAGGYHPTGTPTTTQIQLVKPGGANPSFSAEPASPLGWRVRGDNSPGTSTQSALRNATATVIKVVGTDTIVLDVALPAVPVATDTLYLEMPGAVFSSAVNIGLGAGPGTLQIVGARFTSSLSIGGPGRVSLVGSGAQILAATSTDGLTATPSFVDPTGETTVVGGSVRVEGTTALTNPVGSPSFSAAAFAGTFTLSGKAAALSFSNGSVFGAGLVLNRGTGLSSRLFSATGPQCRVIGPTGNGGIIIVGSDVILGNVDITMPSQNGVVVGNSGVSPSTVIVESSLTGTEATGFRGLILPGSAGSKVILLSQPTITGGSGDIALGDGTTVSWANASARGIVDSNGNQIMPSSGPWPITVTPAGGTVLSGGTLTVPNLGGPGLVKSLNSGGLFVLDTTTYTPTARTLTMTSPLTCDGGSSCDLSSNRTIAGPVFAGSTPGFVPSSSGGTTNFLRADGTFAAPPGGSAVTSGTGPVTFTGPGAAATTVHLNVAGFTGTLPLLDVTPPTSTGFAHVTSGAWDSAARAVDLSGADVANQLPAASVAPSGTNLQVLTTVGGVSTWQTPSAPGVGTVTNVSGTSGQVNVVNNTSTPIISLPNVGPGAVTTGGNGISSVITDAQGRLVSAGTATYLTSTGTTPGTYNNLTVASSGLVTGASITSWMSSGAIMKSAGTAALPVPAVAGKDYQLPLTPCADYVSVPCQGGTSDLGGTNANTRVLALHDVSGTRHPTGTWVSGNILQVDGTGAIVTVPGASGPAYSINWTMNASGLSGGYDQSTLYFPGMAGPPLATVSAAAGTSVAATMAANWGSGFAPPTFPLRSQYNQVELTVDVPLAAASGTGSGPQLTFAIYQVVTNPAVGSNYTEICHTTMLGMGPAGPDSSFQTLGCTGSMTANDASVVLVVYRSDMGNFSTLTNLVFEAGARFWAPQ